MKTHIAWTRRHGYAKVEATVMDDQHTVRVAGNIAMSIRHPGRWEPPRIDFSSCCRCSPRFLTRLTQVMSRIVLLIEREWAKIPNEKRVPQPSRLPTRKAPKNVLT